MEYLRHYYRHASTTPSPSYSSADIATITPDYATTPITSKDYFIVCRATRHYRRRRRGTRPHFG